MALQKFKTLKITQTFCKPSPFSFPSAETDDHQRTHTTTAITAAFFSPPISDNHHRRLHLRLDHRKISSDPVASTCSSTLKRRSRLKWQVRDAC
ncbi:hypothetical protein L6452_11532 [Arctium lappa]|uniref:Uncharacterized protein n=1 Tax=Arctium lappa TaxID=4217 RepID=A0ACB9DQ81_ARCLA|nr:hypothetical protein L6452_11532 [Arctium lappa]